MIRLSLVSCAALLVAAPCAGATTVRVVDQFEGPPLQPGVLIEDTAAETNTLTISYTYRTNGEEFPPPGDGTVTVEDATATLEAGEGCQALGGNRVRCNVDRLVGIRALLGERDDTATAESPDGGMSCKCVAISGGPGNDVLTSRDGASLEGNAGDDRLTGLPSQAETVFGGLSSPHDDGLVGGPGNDVLDGGRGGDGLTGGPGDDVLRGGEGDDRLGGGAFALPGEPVIPAGSDRLDGGPGNDELTDWDAEGGEIGSDELVGGPGRDQVGSYLRANAVKVDLSRRGGQGEPGENDTLVNVEVIFGGNGDDTLYGDGDDNDLHGGQGANRMRGRGGDDLLNALSLRKNRMAGDRGDDVFVSQSWTPGSIDCGRGHDQIIQPPRGMDSPRQPRESDPGIFVSASCEVIAKGPNPSWGIDPVPNRPVEGRKLKFNRARGAAFRKHFLVITRADRPFKRLDRARPTRRGTTVRLPARVARQARRRGATLRAKVYSEIFVEPRLNLIWRFRVKPAR